jgi:nicotinate-nucleotide adenylyltransferase
MTVLYGGAFDPPHLGHVAVADAAREWFGVGRLVVLVNERPAHRATYAPAEDRLALARVAFPDDDVRLDPHPRTVELLRAELFDDPVFVIGADQFRSFLSWSEPAEVLERTRIAVATRPGFPRKELERVLARLDRPDRVLFLEIEPNPAASTAVRARVAAGESLDGLVPPAVARLVAERALYRPRAGDTLEGSD